MSTQGLRATIEAVAAADNGLLATDSKGVEKYEMSWAAAKWVNGTKIEHVKGIWYDANKTVVKLLLVGVVDLNKSHLGSYGNCYWDKDHHTKPTARELGKSKFNLVLTYPVLPPGHVDNDIVAGISNQLYRLDEIQDAATARIRAGGMSEPEKGSTDWVRFEQSERGTQGWVHMTLGAAFVRTTKRVKAKDITDRAPLVAASNNAPKKKDIEEDPEQYFSGLGKHGMRHNDNLPCFKANGDRIGRTSGELRSELYHGRWVKAEVEMVLWNMKDEGKEIFQLLATRVDAIDAPAASMDGIVYASSAGGPSPGGGDDTVSDDDDGEGGKRGSKSKETGSPSKKAKVVAA